MLVNEIEDYEDIKAVLGGTIKQPPTWQVRPEWRHRLIGAFAIERQHWQNTGQLIGLADSSDLRALLTRVYLEENVHQAMFGSLIGDQRNSWDHLLAVELAFLNLAAMLAQLEPDKAVKQVFNYILVDHLAHLKILAAATSELGASTTLTVEAEVLPDGRPLSWQFCPTESLTPAAYGADADPGTKVNIRLVLAMEAWISEAIETLSFAGNPDLIKQMGREISSVEAGHHAMLANLISPDETVLKKAFLGELAEVTGLNRLLATEKQAEAREIYDFVVEEDEDHLRFTAALLVDLEGEDPAVLSESKVFTAKPRRTIEKYLAEIVKAGLGSRPDGQAIAAAA